MIGLARNALLATVSGLVMLGLGAACGGPEPGAWPEAGDLAPVPRVSAEVSPSARRGPSTPPKRLAWTSDEAVTGLAASCNWKSDCLTEVQEAASKSTDILQGVSAACEPYVPLACAVVLQQSCAPDACAQVDYHCVPECNRQCDQCSGECTKGCDACKASCKDDACRAACARGCGECHDACLKKLDHCSSAECAAESEACFAGQAAAWEATDCAKVCPSVTACVEKCPRQGDQPEYAFFGSACPESCFKRLGKGCPSTFDAVCKGGDAGGFFHSWYDERKKTRR